MQPSYENATYESEMNIEELANEEIYLLLNILNKSDKNRPTISIKSLPKPIEDKRG